MTTQPIGRKPPWVQKLPPVDFKSAIDTPLQEAHSGIITALKTDRGGGDGLLFAMEKIVEADFTIYLAVKRLLTKQPPKEPLPLSASILTRTMVDSIFTIVALKGDPDKRCRQYELDGYRHMWEEYHRERQRYARDPKWRNYLAEKKKFFSSLADALGLSQQERKDPTKIATWPTPFRMLEKMTFSNEDKKFLKELEAWRYGELSAQSHLQWTGMGLSVFASDPGSHWSPGQLESNIAFTAALFMTMILSEVEAARRYGVADKLKTLWSQLTKISDEAKDYSEMRYKKTLN
jgi:hypothetical protein